MVDKPTLQWNGVKLTHDSDDRIFLDKGSDGSFHLLYVCCGCHKVHEVHFTIRKTDEPHFTLRNVAQIEGRTDERLECKWILADPKEARKIVATIPKEVSIPDLNAFEQANKNLYQALSLLLVTAKSHMQTRSMIDAIERAERVLSQGGFENES